VKFGYTIIYVADVASTVKFYSSAFGLPTRFVHEGGDYAELDTGETTLAFAAFSLGDANFPKGFTKLSELDKPAGVEIAFVTDDVAGAVTRAVAAGATVIADAKAKPWGQMVAYVRAPDGCVVELCTPVGAAP
jgi:lactoylglutathione lyase